MWKTLNFKRNELVELITVDYDFSGTEKGEYFTLSLLGVSNCLYMNNKVDYKPTLFNVKQVQSGEIISYYKVYTANDSLLLVEKESFESTILPLLEE
jgi:hypothetical protein